MKSLNVYSGEKNMKMADFTSETIFDNETKGFQRDGEHTLEMERKNTPLGSSSNELSTEQSQFQLENPLEKRSFEAVLIVSG